MHKSPASISTKPSHLSYELNQFDVYSHSPHFTTSKSSRSTVKQPFSTATAIWKSTYSNQKASYPKDTRTKFSDSNWGGDRNDRKSTTGYLYMINYGAVSWTSHKQPTVAVST